MNKYTLGTIVGTALLGIAKNSGSKIRLTQGFHIQPDFLNRPFPIVPKNWRDLREVKIKKDCKGNMETLSYYEERHSANDITQQYMEGIREAVRNHEYCLRDMDENGSINCLEVSIVRTEKITEIAKSILLLNETLKKDPKNHMEITGFNPNFSFWKDEEQNLAYLEEKITKTISQGYTPLIYITGIPEFYIVSNFTNGLGLPPTSFLKDLENEIIQKVNNVITPFGFIVAPYGNFSISSTIRRNPSFDYTNPVILKYENEKLIPYKRPESNITKLRKR